MEREISIILKVKGAEAAKKAIESVFNNTAVNQVAKFTVQTQKAGTATQNFARKAKGASTSVDSFSKSLGRGLAKLYLYNRAWAMFGTQFSEGLELQRASDQFGKNVGNVNKMLPELRSATKGVVSDFDLLKTASKAFQLGLKPERMAATFKMGTIAAQKLGLEASDAINTITNAITKQDEGALNTLGIVTNVNQAYKTQAALIAKSGGVMSNAMSIQLRQSLIMAELQKRFGGVNKVQDDGLAVLERFKASWKNFRAEIGQTLGTALIPLTRVLTGFLDTMTRILDKLNDTVGFQKFVQLSATLAGIWAGAKFIAGARTLMNLLGFLGGGKGVTGFTKIRTTLTLVSNLFGILARKARMFTVALSFVAPRLAAFVASIPGIGTAIAAALIFVKPLINGIEKLWIATKVFFQLLNNFDPKSGLSKVLKEDADALGTAYNLIENLAKISLEVWAVLKGVGQGLSQAFAPISGILGYASDKIEEFGGWLFQVDKIAVRSSSRLDAITEKWAKWVKIIGLGASALALFVPGLQVVGALGVAGFGGALVNDAIGLNTQTQAQPQGKRSGMFESGMNGSLIREPQPQTSTQVTTPEPRAMNVESPDEMPAWARTMIKEMQGQTELMVTDSQKQDIRESQSSARNNVWTRR